MTHGRAVRQDGSGLAVAAQPRRPIAAVAASTTWKRFPGQWRNMLDEHEDPAQLQTRIFYGLQEARPGDA